MNAMQGSWRGSAESYGIEEAVQSYVEAMREPTAAEIISALDSGDEAPDLYWTDERRAAMIDALAADDEALAVNASATVLDIYEPPADSYYAGYVALAACGGVR